MSFVLSSFLIILLQANDDVGFWQSVGVKTLDTRYVNLLSFGQVRLYENGSQVLQYKLTQMVRFDPSRYLQLGLNYTYLPTRLSSADDFADQHRAELEFTPRWPVNERFGLDLRNRLELRSVEGLDGLNERSRHRFQATYRLQGRGLLKAVFVSDEVFYDYDRRSLNQNRLVPLGLVFRLDEHLDMSVFYMHQSALTSGEWRYAHVLGTHFSIAF